MITGAPIKALAFIVGIFTAIGAAFGAMNTMYAQVSARTREIGTLRAIGFSRRSILVSFVIEALMLSLIGGAAGLLLHVPRLQPVPDQADRDHELPDVLGGALQLPHDAAADRWAGSSSRSRWALLGGFFPAFRAARLKITTALREV